MYVVPSSRMGVVRVMDLPGNTEVEEWVEDQKLTTTIIKITRKNETKRNTPKTKPSSKCDQFIRDFTKNVDEKKQWCLNAQRALNLAKGIAAVVDALTMEEFQLLKEYFQSL